VVGSKTDRFDGKGKCNGERAGVVFVSGGWRYIAALQAANIFRIVYPPRWGGLRNSGPLGLGVTMPNGMRVGRTMDGRLRASDKAPTVRDCLKPIPLG
jgi:hypothetical protein